jgi:hypothetical protein
MAFRFRRSIKLMPGFRLNFSNSGLSLSVGTRGAWVTFGKKGTRTTVGVPGTGLSYSHLEPHHRSHHKAGPATPAPTLAAPVPESPPVAPVEFEVTFSCDEFGQLKGVFENGTPVGYHVLRKAIEQRRPALMALLRRSLAASQAPLMLGPTHPAPLYSEPPVYTSVARPLQLPPEPTHPALPPYPHRPLRMWLHPSQWKDARAAVDAERMRLIHDYTALKTRWSEYVSAARKKAADEDEASRQRLISEWSGRRSRIETGSDSQAVTDSLRGQISAQDWAKHLQIRYAVSADSQRAELLVDVPTKEIFSVFCPRVGVIDENAMCIHYQPVTDDELKLRYGNYVIVSMLNVAAAALAAGPSVQQVIITTITDVFTPGVGDRKQPLLSTIFEREEWTDDWKFPHSPLHELRRFPTRFNLSVDWDFAEITPFALASLTSAKLEEHP